MSRALVPQIVSSDVELELPSADETSFERRCPVVLVIDTSGSMAPSIEQLNQAVRKCLRDFDKDSLVRKRADVAIITFSDSEATLVRPFNTAREAPDAPNLVASGSTPYAAALKMSRQLLLERLGWYETAGVPFYRPMAFFFSDGVPSDDWKPEAIRFKNSMHQIRSHSFAFALGSFNKEFLLGLFDRVYIPAVEQPDYASLFAWISKSVSAVSCSQAGTAVRIPDKPDGFLLLEP